MSLHSVLISLFIFAFMCLHNSLDNNKHSSGLTMFNYVNKYTTSLLPINNSTAREEILSEIGLKQVLNNMTETSQILTNSGSTPKVESFRPDVYPRDLGDFNVTIFDEKKREDAFEKKPAAESPHAVLLLMYYSKENERPGVCSGSLLTLDWVLTSAHCFMLPSKSSNYIRKVLVYAGGYSEKEVLAMTLAGGSQLRLAQSILPHPNYTGNPDFDIGLVRVSISFNASDTVKPVEISTEPWNHRGYRKCQLTGFGIVQIGEKRPDDQTRKTHNLEVKKPCLCSFGLKMLVGSSVVSRYLCSRPLLDYGPCPGDSGGGLICDGKLRGVTMQLVNFLELRYCERSFIPGLQSIQCGSTNALSVFQESCPFLPWVNSHVRLFNDSQISEECVVRSAGSRTLQKTGLLLMLVLATVIFLTN